LTVAATAFLNALVLLLGGIEQWDALAYTVLFLHLPVAVIEGVILGATVSFLARVKPEMIGLQRSAS
jgi:ABC-type Co2+ transport system permease subunit